MWQFGHMVDDLYNKKGSPLSPLHSLLFPISSKRSFFTHHPTDRILHTQSFVDPIVEHWLEWVCLLYSVLIHRTTSGCSTTELWIALLIEMSFWDIYSGRKEGNILFNDALNTFYLRLYGIRHMVKDISDSERGNPLPPHRLLRLTARILLYAPSHRQDNTYHGLCYTSRGEIIY